MSVISAIRDFIATCPCLDEFNEAFAKVDLDKLEEDATNYMVESVPAEPIVRRYTNGDTVRRVVFAFCSRVFYGDVENIDTSDFLRVSRTGLRIVPETEYFRDWKIARSRERYGQLRMGI